MIATIDASSIKGTIKIPASKSAMQRACALGLLNKGETAILNPGHSNDDNVAINIIKELGAEVYYENEALLVKSNGSINAKPIIDCGESGLSSRMFAAIAALSNSTVLLNGSGTLLTRPMHFIDEVFPLLAVKTRSNKGFMPIELTGPLIPKDIIVDGSASSQYITGLLFAFAGSATTPVSITVNYPVSKPYLDLSMQMLTHFGYKARHENHEVFYIEPVEKTAKIISCTIEADWSSASFLLVAGAIAGAVSLEGLDMRSLQADKKIMEVLYQCNADITAANGLITVSNKNELTAFEFDATDSPDLFPPLTVLAAYCNGTSIIKGVSRLAGKESNRAETLKDVFIEMGVDIVLKEDELHIKGKQKIKPSTISSHGDHRIAMACAIAALRSGAPITIQDAEVVNKSYPAFFEHLKILGASVSLVY